MEDIVLFVCYLSPNRDLESFEVYLSMLRQEIRGNNLRRVIVMGDFNTKSPMWGSPRGCPRGRLLEEFFAEVELEVINSGTPTFIRGESQSHLDVTACSVGLWSRILDWRVDSEENLSLLRNVFFDVSMDMERNGGTDTGERRQCWKFKSELMERA